MFSATKFVVAGAIVALFGGFLLAGVLTTQPSDELPPAVGASASASPEPAPVVTDVYDVGGYTDSLVGSGGAIWIAGDGLVRRIDTQTREVSEVAPRGSSSRYLVTADDAVWASGEDGLLRIEPSTGAVTESYPSLGSWRPPLEAEGSLWVSGDGTLYEVDLESRELVGEYDSPHVGGWIGAGDGELWLWGDDVLARFDLDGREFEGVFPLPSSPWNGSTYEEIHLVSDDAIWMAAEPSGQVLRFDISSREVTDALDLKWYPGASIDTGDAVWIPSGEVVYRIDRQSRQITDEIEVGGSQANPVPVLADGALWVATRDPRAVHRIDLESRQVTHTLDVGGQPWALAEFDGDIWVAGGRGIVTRISTRATDAEEAAEPSMISEPPDLAGTTTPDLLPGVDLVTEEVEPGVYRVLSDGAGHDLVAEPPRQLVFTPDGDLVVFVRSEGGERGADLHGFYALGEAGEQAIAESAVDFYWFDAAFDHDGNLVVASNSIAGGSGRLATFDGETWSVLTWPDSGAETQAVEVGPDGAVWVTTCERGRSPLVARIEGGTWTVLPVPDQGPSGRYCGASPAHLGIATDGTPWFAVDPVYAGVPKGRGLLRFDGDAWVVPTLPIELGRRAFGPLAIGPDGTLWVFAHGRRAEQPALLRLRDGEWSLYTEEDGLPRLAGHGPVLISWLAVDAAGTVWMAMGDFSATNPGSTISPSASPYRLHSFDGSTWKQYLTGHDVHRFDVAPDGSVWATTVVRDCAGQTDPCELEAEGLYVITPEAVTASE